MPAAIKLAATSRVLARNISGSCGTVMGAAIIGLQFGLDRFVTVPAAAGLAVIVGGGVVVYALTAYLVGAVPAGLLHQSNDRNT